MIVLIGGEKGGVGKSTLATNLAVMRVLAGHDVLLVDTDKQGSASSWAAIRDETERPRVPCMSKFGKSIQHDLLDMAKRYEDLIVDAGGRDSVELRAAMVVADVVYVPIRPSQPDIWSLETMEALVGQASAINEGLQGVVLINGASPNPVVQEAAETRDLLTEFENLRLGETVIRDRIVFRKAFRDGLAVPEYLPVDYKGTEEISAFYAEVFGNVQAQSQATG